MRGFLRRLCFIWLCVIALVSIYGSVITHGIEALIFGIVVTLLVAGAVYL